MQTIQLYIGGVKVDMFPDESVDISQSIQNIKDISKIFTDFTKSFSLPVSKTNNKIFKHYYNKDIVNGFDARFKVDARLEINNKPFKSGKIKLDGVDVQDGKPKTYKVTFFGNTVNLKDLIGEDKLLSLGSLDAFNTSYSASRVKTALQEGISIVKDSVTYDNALICPLISNTTRLFYDSATVYSAYPNAAGGNLYDGSAYSSTTHSGVYFEELKYAIRLHLIVKAIEEKYGIVFSTDFFNENNADYYGLYMWLHRQKGRAFEGDKINTQIGGFNTGNFGRFVMIGNALRVYSFGTISRITHSLRITTSTPATFTLKLKKDGQVIDSVNVENGTQATINGELTSTSTGYTAYIETSDVFSLDATWTVVDDYQDGQTTEFVSSGFSVNTIREFIITDHIPDMRVIDFLTGLFKMFNLTAYQDNGTIIIKHLDEFYKGSNKVWALDEYIDSTNEVVSVSLPYREIDFRYKGVDTFLAKNHSNTFNQIWGELKYTSDGYYDSSTEKYEVELPFEHLKYERILDAADNTSTSVMTGYYVDDNQNTFVGNPLIFYPVLSTGTDIRFLNTENYTDANSKTTISSYYVPSNSLALNVTESTVNLNFKAEVNEYTFTSGFTKTLFNKYYQNYIANVFNQKNRITKINATLPLRFLLNYTLADKIRFRNSYYIINSIQTNLLTGQSTFELLNQYDYVEVFENVLVDCLTADSTIEITDAYQYTVDDTCGVMPPDPEPTTCDTTLFIGATPKATDGLACADTTIATSYYHTGVLEFPQVNDFVYINDTCSAPPEDGWIKMSNGEVIQVINENTNLYSRVTSKTSCQTPYDATVRTLAQSDETGTTITLNGTVDDIGFPAYTIRGFYWATGTSTPTSTDNVISQVSSSAGAFSSTINISASTTYTFIAYVRYQNDTPIFGQPITFTTNATIVDPVVTTVAASPVYSTIATLNASISEVGSPAYDSRGFFLVAGAGTPTDANIVIPYGTGDSYRGGGAFSYNTSTLSTSQLYSFRAWLKRGSTYYYGSTLQFTTSAPTCTGGTLNFNAGTATGASVTFGQTGSLNYSSSQCGAAYTKRISLFNGTNGEWVSVNDVISYSVYEGATNVTSNFSIVKSISSTKEFIYLDLSDNFPSAGETSNHTYTINVVVSSVTYYDVNITGNINTSNISLVVTDGLGNIESSSPTFTGPSNKPFEYFYTFTPNSGYDFYGSLTATSSNVSVERVSADSTKVVYRVYGQVGTSNVNATVNFDGVAVPPSATAGGTSIEWRYGTSGTFVALGFREAMPIGDGQVIQIRITPDGAYYLGMSDSNIVQSVSPTDNYTGVQQIHTIQAKSNLGGTGSKTSYIRVYGAWNNTPIKVHSITYSDL